MKIELSFTDISHDIENAAVELFVEDTSEADAPAQQLFTKRIAPILIRRSQPTIIVEIDPDLPENNHELSLFVRVEAPKINQKSAKFINTTTTPISGDPNEFVRVSLERIR